MLYRKSVGLSASEERLQKLIEQRLAPGADKEQIDERIWDLFGEEWAIMFTDLAGFSREVERFGIIHFLQTIYESERLLIPIIQSHDGILLKAEGDSFFVIFRNVLKAIRCAVEMQRVLREYNVDRPEEERVLLCAGLGFGRILRIGDADVYGSEVNAASKLGEDVAQPYEILVTESVQRLASTIEGVSFEELAQVPAGVGRAFRLRVL